MISAFYFWANFFLFSFYTPNAAAIITKFMTIIAVSPNIIDNPKPINMPRPKSFSPNL